VLGVLYALNEKDLKRLLAYSTVENVGIILIALGTSMVFASYGLRELAALALIAALFHLLNHALFKALLFLGAGAVFSATHTRNIEQLGGLAKRMPWTGVLFFTGALSIAAIPPLNGFVSEWLIFQSLLLSFNLPEMTVKILIPITIGMLALTGALGAACFVRAYGIAFLAKPRSEQAAEAREASPLMLAGMGMLALLCVLTGVLAVFLIPYIDSASAVVTGVSVASKMDYGLVLKPVEGTFSSVSPAIIAGLLVLLLPIIYVATRHFGGKQKTVVAATWDCGTPLTARNEYTGTAYSKSIITIFSTVFRPSRELNARPTASPYVSKEMTYSDRVVPLFEKYLYAPAAGAAVWLAKRLSFVQTGSIQAYLAYIFITLVALLIIFR
jgi:hydrogenase-4 component B